MIRLENRSRVPQATASTLARQLPCRISVFVFFDSCMIVEQPYLFGSSFTAHVLLTAMLVALLSCFSFSTPPMTGDRVGYPRRFVADPQGSQRARARPQEGACLPLGVDR